MGHGNLLLNNSPQTLPYIISTVLWVYWGVRVSDMIPFNLGKLFRRTGAPGDLCSKLGIGKEKLMNVTRAVQRYGNLSGFVEQFYIGMRNPTAFVAGAVGVPPDCFFAGVCIGGFITLPIQLAIGFLLRERPMFAVASVATVVGWQNFTMRTSATKSVCFYAAKWRSNPATVQFLFNLLLSVVPNLFFLVSIVSYLGVPTVHIWLDPNGIVKS